MFRAIVLGTVLAILGSATGALGALIFDVHGGGTSPPREGMVTLVVSMILLHTALHLGPGAAVLSLLLFLLLERKSKRGTTRPNLLALALAVGAAAGLLHLLATALLARALEPEAVPVLAAGWIRIVAALTGGLGLGLGCFLGLPRPPAEAP